MLYLCSTPIGNLEDVTLRVLAILRRVDLIACEDTRHTSILLRRHGVSTPTVSLHGHNEEGRLRLLLPLLREGKEVALVSDAGTPIVSDPGLLLVRACAAEDIPVTVLPGPSAVTAALAVAGIPASRFAFVGFLAKGEKQLLVQLAAFDGTGAAIVAFESPRRLRASLGVVARRWPGRQLAVCRELTKLHEEVIRGTAAEILQRTAEPVRGEIVIVLEAAGAVREGLEAAGPTTSQERVSTVLAELQNAGVGTKKAAAIVSELTGLSRREVYERALAVKTAKKDAGNGAPEGGEKGVRE